MRNRSTLIALGALLASTALATPAQGQEASIVPYPVRQFQDENGVDLFSGDFTVLSPAVRIGGDEMGLTYFREVKGGTFRDTMTWNVAVAENYGDSLLNALNYGNTVG